MTWLDTVDPRLFWSGLVLGWLAASAVIGWAFGKLASWGQR